MILLSLFAFARFDCFACTLPVSFTVLGDPVCPGKVARRRPRPWRGSLIGVVSSTGCLKRRGDPSLGSWCPAPTPKERPATTAPYRPRVSKNAEYSRGGGVIPSMVFPSHGYRETALPSIRWRLAVPPPSTVFPTCWYRGGGAASNYFRFLRLRLPPRSFLPVGIGEAALLILGLATPATSPAGVAFCAFPGSASGVFHRRHLERYLYLGIDFDLGPSRRQRIA